MIVAVDVAGGLPCASDWGDESVRQAAIYEFSPFKLREISSTFPLSEHIVAIEGLSTHLLTLITTQSTPQLLAFAGLRGFIRPARDHQGEGSRMQWWVLMVCWTCSEEGSQQVRQSRHLTYSETLIVVCYPCCLDHIWPSEIATFCVGFNTGCFQNET